MERRPGQSLAPNAGISCFDATELGSSGDTYGNDCMNQKPVQVEPNAPLKGD